MKKRTINHLKKLVLKIESFAMVKIAKIQGQRCALKENVKYAAHQKGIALSIGVLRGNPNQIASYYKKIAYFPFSLFVSDYTS